MSDDSNLLGGGGRNPGPLWSKPLLVEQVIDPQSGYVLAVVKASSEDDLNRMQRVSLVIGANDQNIDNLVRSHRADTGSVIHQTEKSLKEQKTAILHLASHIGGVQAGEVKSRLLAYGIGVDAIDKIVAAAQSVNLDGYTDYTRPERHTERAVRKSSTIGDSAQRG